MPRKTQAFKAPKASRPERSPSRKAQALAAQQAPHSWAVENWPSHV